MKKREYNYKFNYVFSDRNEVDFKKVVERLFKKFLINYQD